MTDITNLEAILKVIKDRIKEKDVILKNRLGRHNGETAGIKRELGEPAKNLQKRLREQEREKREIWAGKCPICKTFNEVEKEDVRWESGFFIIPAGHYCKCLHCGYDDVPIRNRNLDPLGGEETYV